ncbi:hypothetical protein [Streptomyces purpurogeneiscleroticus]|uniref:hypothetical protein n=1 Tax=Streptomyces purpurogeneiscleroticus TaxID=68259 RepID=UPI001CBD9840|nr:hypothetical protein [Streptomyces purpurogeneiscleroticus]MBZ4014250.1 hypothetical protein [Streptomyces purpurogeneiscleroticus]
MTVLRLADDGEAADLAAFLSRLLHYDRAAAVRLQAAPAGGAGDGGVLAVFGRPPSFEVLAIRTARLAEPVKLDVTVSAGELLDGIDEAAGTLSVPAEVTGPPWAGVLPPQGGWRRVPGLPAPDALSRMLAVSVAEFRARDGALPPEQRTRAERDRIGREIWSRTVGDTHLPLRAVHAAQSLGFLRPARTPAGPAGTGPLPEPYTLLAAGGWLRLRTPLGSVAVRTGGLQGLSVTPA